MKEFWDSRYAEKEFAYGELPNSYFKQELEKLTPGKLLLPAEGEGRNAVFAAKLGWDVQAVDLSEKGKEKTLRLAAKNNVSIKYHVSNLLDYQYIKNGYDAVVLIFAHFPSEMRNIIHKKLIYSLKSGGIILMEVFSKKQITRESGGPKSIELLYDINELLLDFEDFEILEATETQTELDEGTFHRGIAEVIRIKAQKK
ncbi:MAG: class I SAM-dependent methyltransferase [Bacteroidales bacterium]|nr:class I SAM-dependent methyltransferase [Bacteroidales bacterium]